ncbi:hypothetical protein [Microcoleus sp.]|uniref:hypothetical protein n=1 Tax=Microcoleus sp. TaxID=44472 RepID=UPI003523971E
MNYYRKLYALLHSENPITVSMQRVTVLSGEIGVYKYLGCIVVVSDRQFFRSR